MTTVDYIAASTTTGAKCHAADVESFNPLELRRYRRSLCGERYLIAATDWKGDHVAFDQIMHPYQCQRCVKTIQRRDGGEA